MPILRVGVALSEVAKVLERWMAHASADGSGRSSASAAGLDHRQKPRVRVGTGPSQPSRPAFPAMSGLGPVIQFAHPILWLRPVAPQDDH